MKKKKTTKWQDFKWFFFMKKIRYLLWAYDKTSAYRRFKHCRKGFHYFKPEKNTYTIYRNKKQRSWTTNFFKCRDCNLIVFPTEKDKKNYNLMEKRQNNNMKLMMEDIIKRRKKKNVHD